MISQVVRELYFRQETNKIRFITHKHCEEIFHNDTTISSTKKAWAKASNKRLVNFIKAYKVKKKLFMSCTFKFTISLIYRFGTRG